MEIPAQSGINGRIDVHFEGNIALLTIRRGENRINDSFFDEFNKALDKVESNKNAKVLITTGEGKYYSIGLDLEWLRPTLATTDYGPTFGKKWNGTIGRLLTFPMPTIAAMNGHAYAGGAIIAMAHDYRIMRPDRGWFCLNEVHIGLLFNPFLIELLRMKIGLGQNFTEAVALGKRYTAQEAFDSGITQGVAGEPDVIPDAKQMARKAIAQGGYKRQSLQSMKKVLYQPIFDSVEKGEGVVLKSSL